VKPLAAMARGLAGVLDSGMEEPAVYREYRLVVKELREALVGVSDEGSDIAERLGRAAVLNAADDG